jgi:anaerobic selenocysteine-containing dehydrogenase
MKKVEKTACAMCSICCGLEMEVENNKITNVRPDQDNPRSKGYCCRKGRAAKYYQDHADRLNYPLKRVGNDFVRISWEQAYKEIAEKQLEITRKYGPRVTATIGETLTSTQSGKPLMDVFGKALGTQYSYNPIGLEFMGMFWSHDKIASPSAFKGDEERIEVLVLWGSNTYVGHNMLNSRWVVRHISEDPNRLLVTVDPRLSETARMSDIHVALRPGSDALLLRAMIALILKEGWQDQAYLDKWVSDFEKAKHWYQGFDIEAACRVAGVPYKQIYDLCKIMTTRKWGYHEDLGSYMGRHNTLNSFLLATLSAVCGRLFVPGGQLIYPGFTPALGKTLDENDPEIWKTVATNKFPVLGAYPGGALSAEILSDHPERLRAVYSSMSNTVRSFPDSGALEKAFSRLDLFVVMDMCMTDTARLAHYVLPCQSSYETYNFCFFQYEYARTFCQLRHPVVEAEGERKESAEVWLGLIDAMGFMPPIPDSLYQVAKTKSRFEFALALKSFMKANPSLQPMALAIAAQALGKAMGSVNKAFLWLVLMNASPELQKNVLPCFKPKPMKLLKEAIRKGWDSGLLKKALISAIKPEPVMMDNVFQAVIDHPEGAIIARTDPNDLEDNFKYIRHSDHKIHLHNEVMDEYIKNVTPEKEEQALAPTKEFPFILSAGRRADSGANGMMRNPESYQFRNPCALALNPEDAKELGVSDRQKVRVTTEAGSVDVEAELTYQTRKGYMLIPHTFGFRFGEKTYGVGANELTPAKHMESVTGNPIWRYVPCRVEALQKQEAGQ